MKDLKTLATGLTTFLLGSAIATVAVFGVLGIDPFVSWDTEEISKDHKAPSVPCERR